MSIDGVNNYISFKILKYRYFEFIDNNLLVGGGWGIHRSFLRSRDPRLAST
jgi:hypothetical protein